MFEFRHTEFHTRMKFSIFLIGGGAETSSV
jgi:hypothetical protein